MELPSSISTSTRSSSSSSSFRHVRIGQLIRLLVSSVTNVKEQRDGGRYHSMVSYVNRLITSFAHLPRIRDEFQIKRNIVAKLAKRSDKVKFEELFERFMDKPGIRHKWALLHLLQKLKGCKSRDCETIAATAYTFSLSASSTSHMMKMLTVDDDQNEQKEKEMGGQTRRGSRMQHNQTAAGGGGGGGNGQQKLPPRRPIEHLSSLSSSSSPPNITEQQLLRDVVFVLQGIDGQFIKFDPSIDAYTVVVQTPAADASRDNSNDIMSFLSAPERRLVRLVCEGGWLYLRVQNYLKKNATAVAFSSFSSSPSSSSKFAIAPRTDKRVSSRTTISTMGTTAAAASSSSSMSLSSGSSSSLAPSLSGLVEQSFCGALQRELTQYFHQIATLESEITAKSKGSTAAPGGGKSRLTLRGVYLWSIQLVDNLRLMATICDTVEGARGGALISGIGKFLHHGDPNVEAFVRNVLQRSCVPLFRMIAQWMSAAELKDPFHEFFVTARKSVGVDRLWQDRYRLNTNMIPFFIDKKLAHSILSVGKSINFIQNCCRSSGSSNGGSSSDSYYYDNYGFKKKEEDEEDNKSTSIRGHKLTAAATNTGGGGGLVERMMTRRREQLEVTVSDLRVEGLHKLTFANADKTGYSGLRSVVDRAAAAVNSRLMSIMRTRFGIRKHCLALKKYLLLGQGDFVTRLLDLLREELEEPATKVFRHNLVLVLKAAIQQSNAQFEDQDVLNRLDVRLLRGVRRDSGWDVFSLDYHVGLPLNVVLTKSAIDRYLRVFALLWRLRRVEHALAQCWSMQAAHASKLRNMTPLRKILKKGYLLRNEMAHFVSNLTSYMMFEVLECAWAKFDKEIEKAKDLDALIDAHERYLSQILNGAMMEGRRGHAKKKKKKTGVEQKAEGSSGVNQRGEGGGRQQQPAGVTQLEKLSDVVVELNKMFDVILQFVRLQEHVYEAALEDIELTTQSKIRAYRRQQLGRWGQTAAEEVDEEEKRVFRLSEQKSHKVFERLVSIEAVFSSLLAGLRSRLSDKHSSSDAQFLDVRLDFNEFYDEKKRRQDEEIKHKAAK